MVELTLLHWIYTAMVVVILAVMITRRDTIIPCIMGIFFIGLAAKGSVTGATRAIFDSLVTAGIELFGVILVISLIVAMSKMMEDTGANMLMVRPFSRLIKTPDVAFWFIGVIMLLVSWFFWPSPATALVGAVMLPVGLKAGLPAIGVAMAINLFGHGIALSSDYIIQGAPTITATAAGVEVVDLMVKGIPLVAIMGITTVAAAYVFLKRDMRLGRIETAVVEEFGEKRNVKVTWVSRLTAFLVPAAFMLDVAAMSAFQLRGGDATALVGGTAVILMIIGSVLQYKGKALAKIAQYMGNGFKFGMEIFGPVIPVAAFFYLGEIAPIQSVLGAGVLPAGSEGILSDMGRSLAAAVPVNKPMVATMETVVGAITGLDGSGFSGMSLAGSLARVFGTAVDGCIATLGALGQIGAIWVGGGTLIPWAILPAAAICRVLPIDLARRNFKPVMIGFIVTTIAAMFLI
jgi:hypothetical protein